SRSSLLALRVPDSATLNCILDTDLPTSIEKGQDFVPVKVDISTAANIWKLAAFDHQVDGPDGFAKEFGSFRDADNMGVAYILRLTSLLRFVNHASMIHKSHNGIDNCSARN